MALAAARCRRNSAGARRFPQAQTTLCLRHLTRERIIHRAQKAALRRERPAHWIALDGDAPLGQRTLYWPGTRHIACMAQSKQHIHKSMLLESVSFDAENVTLRNLEGEEELVCTREFCRKTFGARWYIHSRARKGERFQEPSACTISRTLGTRFATCIPVSRAAVVGQT